MNTKFVNKQGWLSQYALACGYCEVNEGWKEQRKATLWRDSACWQVQAYDEEDRRNYWESYDKYTEAKKDYIRQLKLRNAKRTINKG